MALTKGPAAPPPAPATTLSQGDDALFATQPETDAEGEDLSEPSSAPAPEPSAPPEASATVAPSAATAEPAPPPDEQPTANQPETMEQLVASDEAGYPTKDMQGAVQEADAERGIENPSPAAIEATTQPDEPRSPQLPVPPRPDTVPPPEEDPAAIEGNDKATRELSKDAPAIETVASQSELQKEGETAEVAPENQIHSSALPVAREPEKAWQDFMPAAIRGLYPHLREGIDYAVGRRSVTGDMEVLEWSELFAQPDMGKVEEAARQLAGRDPYLDYKPKPSLSGGSVPEADREILDPDVAQSEVNPQRDTAEKALSQPYQPQPEAFEAQRQREEGTVPTKDARPEEAEPAVS